VFNYQRLGWVRKLCRAGMPPSNTDRKAPAAAPGSENPLGGICQGRSKCDSAGAADEGRSSLRGVFEGASARDFGMVSNAEIARGVSDDASARDRGMVDEVGIGSTRGRSRSASMFDGHRRLELIGVSDVAKRENVHRSTNAEIGKGVSNLRSVKCSMANDARIHLRSVGGHALTG
jgi:hypothetical protein